MFALYLPLLFIAAIHGFTLQNDGRIIGGKTVEIKDYPYQISLQYNSKHMCGGSILNEKYIVTAAHCTEGTIAANLKIRAGSSYHARGGQVIPVSKIIQHEKYDGLDYDIAIVELASKIQYGLAQPVQPADEGFILNEGSVCEVSGWGYDKPVGGSKPDQLQALKVPVIGQKVCQDCYEKFVISERMTCAGYLEGGQDACQGDSGGPLVFEGKLVGIVSWGLKCAQPNQPGVYANVAELRTFIKEVTGI